MLPLIKRETPKRLRYENETAKEKRRNEQQAELLKAYRENQNKGNQNHEKLSSYDD